MLSHIKHHTITIFIHGTLPPPALLRIPLVNTFFFCPPGLTLATKLDEQYHLYRLTQLLCSSDPAEFNRDSFYLFGWSGKLRFSERKKAAYELYNHLIQLKRKLESQGISPSFRLITHSHGGNVALYLKEAAEEAHNFIIDELILLACPVQNETMQYVQSSLFKHVFSIHSHKDLFQILDPQGFHSFLQSLKQYGLEFILTHLKQLGPLFSSRHFKSAAHITQLNVKHPRRELLHIEFLLPTFIAALPQLLVLMKEHAKAGRHDELTYIFN